MNYFIKYHKNRIFHFKVVFFIFRFSITGTKIQVILGTGPAKITKPVVHFFGLITIHNQLQDEQAILEFASLWPFLLPWKRAMVCDK